jgi:DNA primase catalytic subunit
MKAGADFFKELVFAIDMDDAKETAELRYDEAKCVNVRRAASHP